MTAGVEVQPIDGAEIESFVDVVETAWGSRTDEETGSDILREQPIGAYLGGTMAGTAMAFSMELTVPGEVQVPMAGISYVAVHPLHRRRGVLRSLMRYQLDDLRSQGVAVAGLGASEAGIYGRFGYGPATWDSSWRLTRGALRGLSDRPGGGSGSLEMVGATTAMELFPAVHEEARRRQVGDVRTYRGRWRDLIGNDGKQFVLCRDADGHPRGYAIYRLERQERWSAHATVTVDHLMASTDAAYYRLWGFLADLDLTDCVLASGRPQREPLHWGLPDRRQLAVTGVHDHLWVRLVDIASALSQRRYAHQGSLLLDVTDRFCPWNEGRWLLEGGPDGAECRRTRDRAGASLRLDVSAVGSLFLGGASLAHMAAARLVAGEPAMLGRGHLMFRADLDPWC
jgi:predicted acetyltransferase